MGRDRVGSFGRARTKGVESGTRSCDQGDPGAVRRAGGKPLHESTPEEARALSASFAAMAGPGHDGPSEDLTVAAADGTRSRCGCSCRRRAPAA